MLLQVLLFPLSKCRGPVLEDLLVYVGNSCA